MATKATKETVADNGQFEWPYGTRNYIVFALALVVIVIGYYTLSLGSMTLAPVLLVVGYCVLIPISLLIKGKPGRSGSEPESIQSGSQ